MCFSVVRVCVGRGSSSRYVAVIGSEATMRVPSWSINLPKAFDLMPGFSFQVALRSHGVFAQLAWIFPAVHAHQVGEAISDWDRNYPFEVMVASHQVCVKSSVIYCAPGRPMASWQTFVWFTLQSSVLFAKPASQAATLGPLFAEHFYTYGLTIACQRETCPDYPNPTPQNMNTNSGIELQILDRDLLHKWVESRPSCLKKLRVVGTNVNHHKT